MTQQTHNKKLVKYGNLQLEVDEYGRAKMVMIGVEGHAGDGLALRKPVSSSTKRTNRTQPVSSPASSPYRSKWEAAYALRLEQGKLAGEIAAFWYEPFSLWLPGGVRYKPDFLIQYPDGLERRLEVVEVKGWSKNRRDGMTRLKLAAALFPCFTWRLVWREGKTGWDSKDMSNSPGGI